MCVHVCQLLFKTSQSIEVCGMSMFECACVKQEHMQMHGALHHSRPASRSGQLNDRAQFRVATVMACLCLATAVKHSAINHASTECTPVGEHAFIHGRNTACRLGHHNTQAHVTRRQMQSDRPRVRLDEHLSAGSSGPSHTSRMAAWAQRLNSRTQTQANEHMTIAFLPATL
jgi:hypothetical protein